MELTSINEMLKSIPNAPDYASYQDLSTFYEYKDIIQQELESSFKKFFFSAPNVYDFYFNIGQSDKDLNGFVIGSGKLLNYKQLPYSLKKYFLNTK